MVWPGTSCLSRESEVVLHKTSTITAGDCLYGELLDPEYAVEPAKTAAAWNAKQAMAVASLLRTGKQQRDATKLCLMLSASATDYTVM